MEEIKNNLQSSVDERERELAEINRRIESWRQWSEAIKSQEFTVQPPALSPLKGEDGPLNTMEIKSKLQKMTQDYNAKLTAEKKTEQLQAVENVRLEQESMLLSKWLKNSAKKVDRLLAKIDEEKQFVVKFREEYGLN